MAKVAILDDYEAYAEMLASPLLRAGHEVLIELRPIDFERVLSFRPEVVSLGLYRRSTAMDRPISRFEEDVVGALALQEMEAYPAINLLPLMLLGSGLREADVPTRLTYDLFLSLPEDFALYLPKIDELATKVKTRRHISEYVCPVCHSRFVYLLKPENLFCPRCHTSAVIIDDTSCLLAPHGLGVGEPCGVADLVPKA